MIQKWTDVPISTNITLERVERNELKLSEEGLPEQEEPDYPYPDDDDYE